MNGHDEMTPRERDERGQIEQRLHSALDAQARASVPDSTMPPPMAWPKERASRRAWLTPLAVAASVLVIVGGVTVATTHRGSEAPPATQTRSATVAPTIPTPTSPTTPSAPSAPSPTAPSATAPQGGTPTTVGGATLVVPVGWSIRQDTGSGQSTPINDTWCVDPAASTTCTIRFVRLDAARNPLNADIEGGLESNPQYCDPATGYAVNKLQTYNDLTMGGRAAEFRSWHVVCNAGGVVIDVAQYTVLTPTAYGLFSEKAAPEVRNVMAGMAASVTLPPATSTTRLYDHGVVRTVTPHSGGGATITIDRVIVGWPNQSPTTYSYVLPAGVSSTGAQVAAPGQLVQIHTDGQVITDISVL